MKTRSKALLLSLCAILLVASTVFGTLAYLTDTENVVNTFTVGHVYITLDEAKVNDMGDPLDENGNKVTDREKAERLTGVEKDATGTNGYHLLPGHTYTKDPTLTVLAGSEEAYVRLLVKVNDMTKLTKAFPKNTEDETDPDNAFYAGDVFLLQNLVDINLTDWVYEKYTAGENNEGTYEFRYKTTVAEAAADTKLTPLFTQLTVPGYITNANLAELQGITITVEGHAIQADGFTTAALAWTAFDSQADKASTPPVSQDEAVVQ